MLQLISQHYNFVINELITLLLHKAPFTNSHNRSLLPLISVTLMCILYLFSWIHSFKTIHKHHGNELLLHYVYELMSYSNLWEYARAPGTQEVRTSKKLVWNSVHLPWCPSYICVHSPTHKAAHILYFQPLVRLRRLRSNTVQRSVSALSWGRMPQLWGSAKDIPAAAFTLKLWAACLVRG